MFHLRAILAFLFAAALILSPAYAARARHASTSSAHRAHTSRHLASRSSLSRASSSRSSRSRRSHGQQGIDSERVTQIQQALIREHYLSGDASGSWDSTTLSAMQKFQADNGWQTKLTPDARALKKLGLGPDYSNAINAKNSSFAAPPSAASSSPAMIEGFAEAAGISH